MRVIRYREREDVPDGAVFLCMHDVMEKVREPREAYGLNTLTGERTPTESYAMVVRPVPYAWFLVP